MDLASGAVCGLWWKEVHARRRRVVGNAIATMFSSKKFLAALGTVILIVLEDVGVPIPEEVVVPLVAYIVAQGLADIGKERAKA